MSLLRRSFQFPIRAASYRGGAVVPIIDMAMVTFMCVLLLEMVELYALFFSSSDDELDSIRIVEL